MQKNELDPCLITYIKIHSKCIKNFNVKPRSITLLGENIRENLLIQILAVIFLI